MAKENSIMKDFVKKQSSPISIGKPKIRSNEELVNEGVAEKKEQPKEVQPIDTPTARPVVRTVLAPVEELTPAPKKVGRPKGDVEKVKISIYVPAEVKEKIVKLQHMNMKSSINDVMMEAVNDLLDKYTL